MTATSIEQTCAGPKVEQLHNVTGLSPVERLGEFIRIEIKISAAESGLPSLLARLVGAVRVTFPPSISKSHQQPTK